MMIVIGGWAIAPIWVTPSSQTMGAIAVAELKTYRVHFFHHP